MPLLQANGYRFMFLSSRAIAQASTTRDYLQRLNQDGHRLPAGVARSGPAAALAPPEGILSAVASVGRPI